MTVLGAFPPAAIVKHVLRHLPCSVHPFYPENTLEYAAHCNLYRLVLHRFSNVYVRKLERELDVGD